MKKILSFFLAIFLLAGFVFAQETPEQIAARYGVTFPVAELGGCEDLSSCRTYCEDPVNQTTCEAFARAKGFYKDDGLSEREEQLLSVAKSELGCSDKASCEAVCHLPENFDKCSSFARRNGLSGGHTEDPGKEAIITRAKEVLGCDSESTCRAICEQESNRDKCNNFARQVGLRGGEVRRGPGGCSSEQTCQTYCTDPSHFSECSSFGESRGTGGFSGPGGCNSQESCQAYCQKNPNSCHSFAGEEQKRGDIEQCFGSGKFWYDEKCNDRPMSGYFERVNDPRIEECFKSGRFWNGRECQDRSAVEQQYQQRKAQEYADYCRANPDKCRPGETGTFTGNEERTGFESFCTKYPDRCRTVEVYGGAPTPGGPADNQPRCGGGTYWNGSTCVYPNNATPAVFSGCPIGTYWNGSSCLSSQNSASNCPAGQYWNGSSCISTTQQQKTPEQMCVETTNCRWENNACNCNTSSGSNTSLSPEQQCSQSGKCWRDGNCQDCSSGSYPTPATSGGGECESKGGHWENGACVGAVQGATVSENFFQQTWRLFTSWLKPPY